MSILSIMLHAPIDSSFLMMMILASVERQALPQTASRITILFVLGVANHSAIGLRRFRSNAGDPIRSGPAQAETVATLTQPCDDKDMPNWLPIKNAFGLFQKAERLRPANAWPYRSANQWTILVWRLQALERLQVAIEFLSSRTCIRLTSSAINSNKSVSTSNFRSASAPAEENLFRQGRLHDRWQRLARTCGGEVVADCPVFFRNADPDVAKHAGQVHRAASIVSP